MYENKEQSGGGIGRCVRAEHCDGRCGETALDSDHVRWGRMCFAVGQIEVILARRGRWD